jgi:Family of unknown function (DUF6220)
MRVWGLRVHMVAAWLFAAGVLVQGYLAGQAMPELGGSGDFEAHSSFGFSIMGIIALVVLVAALVARLPRAQVGLSVLLFILYIVQTSLPAASTGNPSIAALHPANAMVLLVLAIVIGWRARRLDVATTFR